MCHPIIILMMRTTLFTFILALVSPCFSVSQVHPVPSVINHGIVTNTNLAKGVGSLEQPRTTNIEGLDNDLHFSLQRTTTRGEYQAEAEEFKRNQTARMLSHDSSIFAIGHLNEPVSQHHGQETDRFVDPQIGNSFSGSSDVNSFPNDDDVAISASGKIVQVSNSNMTVWDEYGFQYLNTTLGSFFNMGFNTNVYDPHVIYDNELDRFIMICLSGNNSSNNQLILAFSQTNDPAFTWTYYTFSVAQTIQSGTWMDYPLIGINATYVSVTGNLFYDGGNFSQTAVLRFDKATGFQGAPLAYTYWYGVVDQNGNPSFTLCPLSYGAEGSYVGNACLFVSTNSFQGSYYQFWVLDNSNNQLNGYVVATNQYAIGSDVVQLGANVLLDAGDCRVSSAIYLYDGGTGSGYIHFVFTSTYQNSGLNNGIIKAMIEWTSNGSLSSVSSAYGLPGTDYTHPAIAYIGNTVTTGDVVIGALYAASNAFPSAVVFTWDNSNNVSFPLFTQFGGGAILNESSDANTCRWGDYVGVKRRYFSSPITGWTALSHGTAWGTSGTWIAEIGPSQFSLTEESSNTHSEPSVYPNPVFERVQYRFDLPMSSNVRIHLLDAQGKIIRQFHESNLRNGQYQMAFDRSDLPSGIYFLSVVTSDGQSLLNEKLVFK